MSNHLLAENPLLSTAIPTPDGWTTLGEVEVGTTLFGRQGAATTVIEVEPERDAEVYEMELADAQRLMVSGTSRWTVYDLVEMRERTLSIHDLAEAMLTRGGDEERKLPRYSIGLTRAVPGRKLQGVTLGEITEAGRMLIIDERPSIPEEYLRATVKQRDALLRGILTQAPRVSPLKGWAFSSDLVWDVAELARSLGLFAQVHDRPQAGFRLRFRFANGKPDPINGRIEIVRLAHLGAAEGRYLSTAAPEDGYLIGGFIPMYARPQ
ncbi:hypothetical protein [Nesterenkonia rhizosphaerae]|uniref:Uncharacterized protein n=1 Tax=Nesterenkonia rhizosphaerae TaxID=1348272 RepID=A0ABP9G0Q7_9MICC